MCRPGVITQYRYRANVEALSSMPYQRTIRIPQLACMLSKLRFWDEEMIVPRISSLSVNDALLKEQRVEDVLEMASNRYEMNASDTTGSPLRNATLLFAAAMTLGPRREGEI